MKRFFGYIVATIIGISLFFVGLFLFFMVVGAAMSGKEEVSISPNSILYADFKTPIKEQGTKNPLADLDLPIPLGGSASTMGLNNIVDAFEKAKTDDNIKGLYLDLGGISAGWTQIEDIRNAILDFKESGKFVTAYGEVYTQKAYYLASIADEVYMHPSGSILLKGFGGELTFFKGMLDKLEIEPEIVYVGKYKSATEPFRFTQMSDENREQVKTFLTDIYDVILTNLAEARNLPRETVHDIINELKVRLPEQAVEHKMIDQLSYESAVFDILREKTGLEEDDKLKFTTLGKYIDAGVKDDSRSKNKVAVVYAEGSIVDGMGDGENIASERYAKILRKIQRDKKVKAVVLRVNSGGGSALASDVIWDEINQIKEMGIPVYTSMGDVAASGGYYIAANSDKIYAQENTITGSIGVFGLLADADKFYENKLGITFDTVKVTKFSDFPTSPLMTNNFTAAERNIVQDVIDKIYADFLIKVGDGRDMDTSAVHEIAQGRVWTGKRAKTLGLVDELGSLDAAIADITGVAGIADDYRLSEYPKQKDPFEEFLTQLQGGGGDEEVARRMLRKKLGHHFAYLEEIEKLIEMHPYQMRMPFYINMD